MRYSAARGYIRKFRFLECNLVAFLLQEQVREDQGGHAFDTHGGAHGDAGVVPASCGERPVFAFAACGVLFLGYRRGGLEREPAHDGFAVRDAAKASAGIVRARVESGLVVVDFVVVFAAVHAGGLEPAPDFETLAGRDAEHRLREQRVEAVEHGFAEALRRVSHQERHRAADAVCVLACPEDDLLHGVACGLVRAAHGACLDLFQGNFVQVDLGTVHLADGRNPGEDFRAGNLVQKDAGDFSAGHAADGLAGGTAATAAVVPESVLDVVAQVRMSRTVPFGDFGIVTAALVLVEDGKADRGPRRLAFEDARKDFYLVFFVARGGHFALAGPSAIERFLDIGFADGQACGATVEHGPDSGTV